MTEKIEVLICGAGAAGLTLAIDLARRGISFRLIEKLDVPFPGSRGKGIQPRTQEIFEDIGIIDRLFATGGLYPMQREYGVDGSFTDSDELKHGAPTAAEPYYRPLMVPQFLTEGVMRERLSELGHVPEFACELLGFEQDENGVTTRLKGKAGVEIQRASYLVGADGGRSFVRQTLGIDFPGKTLDMRAIVADIHLIGLGRDAWHRFNSDSMGQQLYLCPLMGTELFQLQAPVPLNGDVDLTAAGLAEMVALRTGRSDIVIKSVSWASAYSMNARLAERYRAGRVFLAGDAAHIHPPTGGQGLNTSIQDAYNLGWKLAAVIKGAPVALLGSYEQERRPIAADMLGLSTRLLDAAKRGDTRRGREVHQLDLGYAEGVLALETVTRHSSLRAGNRAPDASLRGAAGQRVRLFDLFKGTHWTLLGYETERASVPARAGLHIHMIDGDRSDLIDDGGYLHDAYALPPGHWVLVRPDGYVGAIVGATDVAALEHYFEKIGLNTHADRCSCEQGKALRSWNMV